MSEINFTYRIAKTLLHKPLKLNSNYLHQISKTFFEKTSHVNEHIHKGFFELTYITDGEGTIYVNNEELHVKKYDICLTFPDDKHEIKTSAKNPLKIYAVAFSTKNKAFLSCLNYATEHFKSADKRVFQNSEAQYIITHILSEVLDNNNYSKNALSSYLNLLIINVLRNFSKEKVNKNKENLSDHKLLCYKVMSYIDANILTIKKLTEISEISGYNYSYLSTVFKNTTGTSLKYYFQNAKLEKAKSLIKDEGFSISKTAQMLNYQSPNALSRAYKKKFFVSPKKDKN